MPRSVLSDLAGRCFESRIHVGVVPWQTDRQQGDVITIITGDYGFHPGANGLAPDVDKGNDDDEIVWVFGEGWASAFSTEHKPDTAAPGTAE